MRLVYIASLILQVGILIINRKVVVFMANKEMHKWEYDGPVRKFDYVFTNKWVATTMAPTKMKALSNLTYRIKKENKVIMNCIFKLDPKYLKMVE